MNDTINWIFFAAQSKPTSMRRAIAERLAERESVIIVEQPVSLVRDRAFMPLSGRCFRLGKGGNSWHYRPMYFPEKFPGVGRIFSVLNEELTQREMDKLVPPQMTRIVCYDSPTQYHLVKKFRERQSVYLAIDDRTLTVWGDSISGEEKAETRLLKMVDYVICVSASLAQTLKSRTPEGRTLPIFVLPNGYDERIFDPSVDYPEPVFLKDVPRPRILIAGHVSERIDWDGIVAASRLRPEWTWIFLGPVDPGIEDKARCLLGSLAVLHPPIPVQEVPASICHSDVCAIPYRLNRFTLSSHPLKAFEYLAMGAHVLSTKIPSLNGYHEGIEWVEEGDGLTYAKVLDAFMQKKMKQKLTDIRRKIVEKETLEERVNQFRNIVLSSLKR